MDASLHSDGQSAGDNLSEVEWLNEDDNNNEDGDGDEDEDSDEDENEGDAALVGDNSDYDGQPTLDLARLARRL